MRQYPKMKDSGIEWIGEIPEHWEVKKIKRETGVKRGASPRPIDDPVYFDENGEFSWVRISDVTASNGILNTTEQKLSSFGSSLSVKMYPGDLFLSIAGSVGKPCITAIKCCIHDGFVYFPQLKSEKKFLYYIFDGGECYKGLGKLGTQLNLNTDTVGDIHIPVPPKEEQNFIVEFIDNTIAKIDSDIQKNQKLIELLKEKSQAIIHHAVTKGLDPNVPVKDSEIEWIGEIPEHWEIFPYSIVVKRITYGFTNPMPISEEGPWLLTAKDIKDGKINYNTARKTKFDAYKFELTDKSRPSIGTVLITKDGTLGETAIVDTVPLCINQSVASMEPNKKILSEFLQLSLNSNYVKNCIILFADVSTMGHISITNLSKWKICLPPITEQKQITDSLNQHTSKIDSLIQKTEFQIEKLHEYRQTLISSAVTGKINVREEIIA